MAAAALRVEISVSSSCTRMPQVPVVETWLETIPTSTEREHRSLAVLLRMTSQPSPHGCCSLPPDW